MLLDLLELFLFGSQWNVFRRLRFFQGWPDITHRLIVEAWHKLSPLHVSVKDRFLGGPPLAWVGFIVEELIKPLPNWLEFSWVSLRLDLSQVKWHGFSLFPRPQKSLIEQFLLSLLSLSRRQKISLVDYKRLAHSLVRKEFKALGLCGRLCHDLFDANSNDFVIGIFLLLPTLNHFLSEILMPLLLQLGFQVSLPLNLFDQHLFTRLCLRLPTESLLRNMIFGHPTSSGC